MKLATNWISRAALCLVVVLLAGCGRDPETGKPSNVLTGQVLRNQQPVERGTIILFAVDDAGTQQGPASATPISRGGYQFTDLKAGKYQLLVYWGKFGNSKDPQNPTTVDVTGEYQSQDVRLD